jgi:hypothetical protein
MIPRMPSAHGLSSRRRGKLRRSCGIGPISSEHDGENNRDRCMPLPPPFGPTLSCRGEQTAPSLSNYLLQVNVRPARISDLVLVSKSRTGVGYRALIHDWERRWLAEAEAGREDQGRVQRNYHAAPVADQHRTASFIVHRALNAFPLAAEECHLSRGV